MSSSAHTFSVRPLEPTASGASVVGVFGEFDARTVADFEAFFAEHKPDGPLVLCLAGTTIIDSSALGATIRLHTQFADAGHACTVHRPRDFQGTLLTITGLDEILDEPMGCSCDHGEGEPDEHG